MTESRQRMSARCVNHDSLYKEPIMSGNKSTITLDVVVLTIAATASVLVAQPPPAAAPGP